ncbi:SAM pointed domain-containing Ets transcription factor [Geodia barretti]|uniref:SAM pointed domain-containing Ets transcription factor n=1 Tax=Geodia barretti TaxID=519541 RepID=A0AA35TY74_GEOBA|nr:SAM pointed domain-containing Ets transcription factor [Geodia barretti]
MLWNPSQVWQWLDWFTEQVGFNPLNKFKWQVSGIQLCALSKEDFLERCPPGLGEALHSQLCLLKAKAAWSHIAHISPAVELPTHMFGSSPFVWPSAADLLNNTDGGFWPLMQSFFPRSFQTSGPVQRLLGFNSLSPTPLPLPFSTVPSYCASTKNFTAESKLDFSSCITNTQGQCFTQSHPGILGQTTPNSPSSPAIRLQNTSVPPYTVSQRHSSVAVPTASVSSKTTAPSQIPTSLQRLVRGNLSATLPLISSPIPQSKSISEIQQLEKRCIHSNRRRPPIPLSIKSTSLTATQSDEVVSTPATPLSPYCGQQGMFCCRTQNSYHLFPSVYILSP